MARLMTHGDDFGFAAYEGHAGGLAGLALVPQARTYAQLSGSWAYWLGLAATTLVLAAALALWSFAAIATAKHLDLARRVRAAEKMLAAVVTTAVMLMVPFNLIWYAAIQPSAVWLVNGLALLALAGTTTPRTMRLAVRRSRRLWSSPRAGR